jgi:hypothetical protein
MNRKAYSASFTQQSGDPHASRVEFGKTLQIEFGQCVKPDY